MLNGMSLAGISEFVHEIRNAPHEAQIVFRVAARPTADGDALVSVETVDAGSIRIPRRFCLQLSNGGSDEAGDQWRLTPYDCLLTGLGSCALIVYVQALTLRGVAIDGLEVAPVLEFTTSAAGSLLEVRRLGYAVTVDGALQRDLLRWVDGQVRRYSPNYRTIAEQNPIAVFVGAAAGPAPVPVAFDAGALDSAPENTMSSHSVRLRWRFGTQIEVRRGSRSDVLPLPAVYEVDQPKQLLGIDRAPNPQEWLLASLAGELALRLSRDLPEAERHRGMTVRVSGRLDLRGTLGVDPDVPTKVQDLQVSVDGLSSDPDITHIVRRAFETGMVSRLIAHAQTLAGDQCHRTGGADVIVSSARQRDRYARASGTPGRSI